MERTSLHAAFGSLALIVLTVLAQTPAHAVNEPFLSATHPRDVSSVRSDRVGVLTSIWDRDLALPPSDFQLKDPGGTPVTGVVYLAGDRSETAGYRTLAFRPNGTLSEAASPYAAVVRACPFVPGDCTVITFSFWIDNTAPIAPTVGEPTNGQVVRAQVVVVRGQGEAGARIAIVEGDQKIAESYASGSGAYTVQLPYPNEDAVQHTITAYAIDEAGNQSPPSPTISFVHDSVMLVPIITSPAEGASLVTTTVTVGGIAKADSTVYLYRYQGALLGTSPVNASGRWASDFPFAEGAHSVVAFSYDGYSFDGPSNVRSFSVDLTAPSPPVITAPTEGQSVPRRAVTVAGAAEPNVSVRVSDETGGERARALASSSGTYSATIDFTEGAHTVTAISVDAAGNFSVASAPRNFIVDTIAPPVPSITAPAPAAYLASGSVTVAGRAEAGARVIVEEDLTQLGSVTAAASGDWSVGLSFPDGSHAVTARAVDGAGNASARSNARTFFVDTAAPAIPVITSPLEGAQFTTGSAFVAGTAEASTQVFISEGTTTIGTAPVDRDGNWSRTLTFANGEHTIKAKAADLASNQSGFSPGRTFTIGATLDTTPPAPPVFNEPLPASLQPGFVVFRGYGEVGATIRVYEGGFALGSATADASGFWQLGANMGSGPHTVTADATDPAGNRSDRSAPRSFRVDALRPTVTLDEANLFLFLLLDPTVLEGGAADDNGVVRVELEYENAITGADFFDAPAVATCTGCPETSVRWRSTPTLTPGIYRVRAYAVDLVGNRSFPAQTTIYRL